MADNSHVDSELLCSKPHSSFADAAGMQSGEFRQLDSQRSATGQQSSGAFQGFCERDVATAHATQEVCRFSHFSDER